MEKRRAATQPWIAPAFAQRPQCDEHHARSALGLVVALWTCRFLDQFCCLCQLPTVRGLFVILVDRLYVCTVVLPLFALPFAGWACIDTMPGFDGTI